MRLQIGDSAVAQSAVDEVQSRAAAAEEKVQRAEATLRSLLENDMTGSITAEMNKLQADIANLRKVHQPLHLIACAGP